MLPESEKYLRDMLDAIQAIEDRVRGLDLQAFLASRITRDAVTWNLCVVGEALGGLRKRDPALADRITDARKIIGLRNQLIHGYAVINHRMTWETVTTHVPVLRRELDQLLAP